MSRKEKNARTPEEKKVERRGQLAGSTVHEHDLLARKHTELARPRPPHVHFVPEPLGGAPPHLNNKERRFRETSFVLSACCGKKKCETQAYRFHLCGVKAHTSSCPTGVKVGRRLPKEPERIVKFAVFRNAGYLMLG